MEDEITQPLEEQETTPEESLELTEEVQEGQEPGDSETPTTVPQEPDPLEQRLSALENTITDLRMENEYLKGQRNQQQQQFRQPQQIVEEDEDPYPSEEEIEQGIRANPAGTIRNLLQRAEARAEKKVARKFEGRLSAQAQLQRDFATDDSLFQKNYGDLFNEHKEFNTLTNRVYQGLTQQFGNIPGLKSMAAATAYGQLARVGKVPIEPTNNNGGSQQQMILNNPRNQVRRVQAANPQAVTKPGTRPLASPKKLFVGFSPTEVASAKRTAQKLGLTEEEFYKSYLAAKAEGGDEYA